MMLLQNVQKHIIKKFFKIVVASESIGRMRLRISNFRCIPTEVIAPYLPALYELLSQVEGVTQVQINDKIGSVLLKYNENQTTGAIILKQVDHFIETGFQVSDEIGMTETSVEEIQQRYFQKLEQ